MSGEGHIVEIHLEGYIFNTGAIFCSKIALIGTIIIVNCCFVQDFNPEIILAVSQCRIGKKFIANKPVPTQSRGDISPSQSIFIFIFLLIIAIFVGGLIGKIEFVISCIKTSIQSMFSIKTMIDFGIDIIEIITGNSRRCRVFCFLNGKNYRFDQSINIGAACRNDK